MLFPGKKTTLALERTAQYSISAFLMVGQLLERMMSLASPDLRERRVDLQPNTYLPLLMTRPSLLLMFQEPTFLTIPYQYYIKLSQLIFHIGLEDTNLLIASQISLSSTGEIYVLWCLFSQFMVLGFPFVLLAILIPYFIIIISSTMVKISTITHDPTSSVTRTPNADHPFSRAREFQRAYNATKLNKIFAKPFLGTLTGHSDGISVLAKCPLALNKMISGAHDGQIRIWDIAERKSLISLYDHNQTIKGVSFSKDGLRFLSSSADKSIHLYDFKTMFDGQDSDEHVYGDFKINRKKKVVQPLTKYLSKLIIGNVDHSPQENEFATAGQVVQIWSYERTKPIYQLEWNIDSILKVKYNPSDSNILCASCVDRSIILYDLRGETPVQKITLPNKSMCLSFNPIEPINFTVGNDDSNCYSFDMRKMDKAKTIHKDHIGAIIDLDFSPTGREFTTGSFDKTIRIFNYDSGRSKEVYHAKRMQIVSSVQYTVDSQYILSGSEDMNIRLWKSVAWRPTGTVNTREERAIQYREKLIGKYIHSNKIRRIANYRHLPKYILNANKRKQDQTVSRYNKKLNKEANTGIKEERLADKAIAVENIEIPEEKIEKKRNKKNKQAEEREEDEGLHYE